MCWKKWNPVLSAAWKLDPSSISPSNVLGKVEPSSICSLETGPQFYLPQQCVGKSGTRFKQHAGKSGTQFYLPLGKVEPSSIWPRKVEPSSICSSIVLGKVEPAPTRVAECQYNAACHRVTEGELTRTGVSHSMDTRRLFFSSTPSSPNTVPAPKNSSTLVSGAGCCCSWSGSSSALGPRLSAPSLPDGERLRGAAEGEEETNPFGSMFIVTWGEEEANGQPSG